MHSKRIVRLRCGMLVCFSVDAKTKIDLQHITLDLDLSAPGIPSQFGVSEGGCNWLVSMVCRKHSLGVNYEVSIAHLKRYSGRYDWI